MESSKFVMADTDINNEKESTAKNNKKVAEVNNQRYLGNGDGNVAVDGDEKPICFIVVRVFVHDGLYFDQIVGLVNRHVAAEVERNAWDPG